MSSRDSTKKTLLVAFILCVICSIVVSGTAVILKPLQDENRVLDRNKNILSAAGLFDGSSNSNAEVEQLFSQFRPRLVSLQSGRFLSNAELSNLQIDLASYDQRLLINNSEMSESIPRDLDIANIRRRALYQMVYVMEVEGEMEIIVLPISGYGLWGILYGFLALEGDANTVRGLAFYELKETPGLGAEVRNPRWMGLWPGKKVYNASGEVSLRVVKGIGRGEYQIDGLSGATLTSRGVDNMIQYWLGDEGFGPLLADIRNAYAGQK